MLGGVSSQLSQAYLVGSGFCLSGGLAAWEFVKAISALELGERIHRITKGRDRHHPNLLKLIGRNFCTLVSWDENQFAIGTSGRNNLLR